MVDTPCRRPRRPHLPMHAVRFNRVWEFAYGATPTSRVEASEEWELHRVGRLKFLQLPVAQDERNDRVFESDCLQLFLPRAQPIPSLSPFKLLPLPHP